MSLLECTTQGIGLSFTTHLNSYERVSGRLQFLSECKIGRSSDKASKFSTIWVESKHHDWCTGGI